MNCAGLACPLWTFLRSPGDTGIDDFPGLLQQLGNPQCLHDNPVDLPSAQGGTPFVASFGPWSRVRPGDEIEVAVDRERMHFFDPDTGLAIRG